MRIASILALFMTLAWPIPAEDGGTEERALRELWTRFEEAGNQFDADKLAGFYAADGDRINGEFELARGRSEIAKQYEAESSKRRADPTSRPVHAVLSIRMLRPDVALLDGTWSGVRAGSDVRGHFTVVATKEAGNWQIVAGRVRGIQQR